MSLIDISQVFVDLKNKPIENNGESFTLKDALLTALMTEFPNEHQSVDDKVKRFKLAIKINSSSCEIELTAEEISFLKAIVGRVFGALIVGQAYDLLEQKT